MTKTSDQMCALVITNACHLHAGNASRIATNSSFSRIFADGICQAMILQKIQSISVNS